MAAKHTSYSAITTFTNCGEQYRLQKIHKVPEVPAWWSWGGTAVHAVTEKFDLLDYIGEDFDEADIPVMFAHALDLAKSERPAPEGAIARSSRNQGEEWWLENGPQMVLRYIAWRRTTGWQLATFPTESNPDVWLPAIELEVKAEFGGLPVLAYIDRVFVMDDAGQERLVIVDLKAGANKPKSTLQLGFYKELIESVYGVTCDYGAYYMARTGQLTDLDPLMLYSKEYLDRMVSPFRVARENDAYVANPTGTLCGVCGVAYACYAKGGPDAHLYAPNATERNETETA